MRARTRLTRLIGMLHVVGFRFHPSLDLKISRLQVSGLGENIPAHVDDDV